MVTVESERHAVFRMRVVFNDRKAGDGA